MTEARNRNQWLSVASFLALQNLRTVLQQKARRAEGAPLAGEAAGSEDVDYRPRFRPQGLSASLTSSRPTSAPEAPSSCPN